MTPVRCAGERAAWEARVFEWNQNNYHFIPRCPEETGCGCNDCRGSAKPAKPPHAPISLRDFLVRYILICRGEDVK